MTDMEKLAKSTQEQAVAAWINYLNQLRLDRLIEALNKEQLNLNEALRILDKALDTIENDIVHKGLGRGGIKGMHGFIAEVAECGIGNARSAIEGKIPVYQWINDDGPIDLIRGVELIQQKFSNAGNHLSLRAILQHYHQYPDYLSQGLKYQIPKDHYDRIMWLLSIPEEQANKMPTQTGEFSLDQWKEVHNFFNNGPIPLEKIEPSVLEYKDVQRGTYQQTFETEKKHLVTRNEERRYQAYQNSKPTFSEGAKATAASAAIEGCTELCLAIAQKRKEGKKFTEFSKEDWIEIAGESGIGTVKGGVRGAGIYILSNYMAVPASVASSLVTASFGVADQAYKLRSGELSELEFIENSEMLCLDAAVSGLSSLAGQALIPIPVLGAVIGNAVGTVMYRTAKDSLNAKETALIKSYLESVKQLNASLENEYQEYIVMLSEDMERYMDILERAYDPDVRIALKASIEQAREMGVPEDEILDSNEKSIAYFVN